MAVKRKRLAKEVVGLCRRRISKDKAEKFKAVDWATLNFKQAIKDADLVIVAVPIAQVIPVSLKASKFMKAGAILTDTGSVKGKIVKSIETKIRKDIYFIGGHPMAGSEKSGIANAKSDLYRNSLCILTKSGRTNSFALAKVKKFWRSLGIKISMLTPKEHDHITSEISHLPHLLAMSLCLSTEKKALPFASSGFKDTTRIAASTAELWSDIFLYNKISLLKSVNKLEINLRKLKRLINGSKRRLLFKELEKARSARQRL